LADLEQREAEHAQLVAMAEQCLEESRLVREKYETDCEQRAIELEESRKRLSNPVSLEVNCRVRSATHDIADDAWDCESCHGAVDFDADESRYNAVNHSGYSAFNDDDNDDDDNDDRSISSTFEAFWGL